MGLCYIVGASPERLLPIAPGREDLLIAADGGLSKCRFAGLTPHLCVGDFDSLGFVPEDISCQVHPVRKDDTDTALALSLGYERGYRDFALYCAAGGRPDHSFANYLLAGRMARKGCRVWLFGEGFSVTAICREKLVFPAGLSGTVSVFPLGGEARGVRESGLSYELSDRVLSPLDPLGVSNAFTGQAAEISVREGTLLIFVSGVPGTERLSFLWERSGL